MIPRIVHQTWRDAAIPPPLGAYAETWRRHHPAWAYRLWTDADLAELVETRFPELAPMFHGYPLAIMRADLGRYLVLKAHGGVYADLDAEALRPWDGMLAAGRPLFAEEPPAHAAREFVRARGFRRVVSNAVIASPPEHPFWEHFVSVLRRCRQARNPLDATGPFVLTAAIDAASPAIAPEVLAAYLTAAADNAGDVVPVPAGGERMPPLARHHWHGTWWRNRQEGPAGFADSAGSQAARPSWRWQLREWIAQARLRASSRAAKALAPAAPPAGSRILVAIPVRDAAPTLDALFAALLALDHPKRDISLAFLEGDSADDSFARLAAFARAQRGHYRRIALRRRALRLPRYERRWEPEIQRARRANLARVRNLLLRGALNDEDWVLWLDADVVALPRDLVATLLAARARVVQPNTVLVPGGPSFDANAWTVERVLSEEAMRKYVLRGLYQPPLGYERLYLSDLRYRERVPLDSVGGTALLVDARLHRAGIGFPETPYRCLIETEGFGALLRDHGIEIAGLPNVEVVHANA